VPPGAAPASTPFRLDQRRCELVERIKFRDRQPAQIDLVTDRRFGIARVKQTIAKAARCQLRHRPFAGVDSDLPVARIEIGLVRYIDDLVGPVVKLQQTRLPIVLRKPFAILARPSPDGPHGRHPGVAADCSERLAFAESDDESLDVIVRFHDVRRFRG